MVGSRVYVGGLPPGTTNCDLEKFFEDYGRTRDISIKDGYGFVEFEDYCDAEDAVYELNGKELLGERVVVEPARETALGSGGGGGGGRYDSSLSGPPLCTEHRLIVENLSLRVSWQDLKDYMRRAGEVTYADINVHKQNCNEGVVEFASASDMKTAIEKLDDTELEGSRICLVEDMRGSGGDRHTRFRSNHSSRSRSKCRGSRLKSPAEKKSRSRSRSSEKSRSRSRDRDSASSGSNASESPRESPDRDRSRSPSRSASPECGASHP